MTPEEATARAEAIVQDYASSSPYRLVDDPVVLRNLLRGLARNWVRRGAPYCPCKKLTGDPERDRRIVCPCEDHPQEIEQTGSCCCGLYYKED